jgi:hypothetical protein
MTNIENAQIKELSNQIEAQNIRLEAQNTRLEQNNIHVAEIKNMMGDIQTALLGNPISKDGGIIKRLEIVEADNKGFNVMKSKWLGIVWFVVGGAGALGLIYYATSIYKNLIK